MDRANLWKTGKVPKIPDIKCSRDGCQKRSGIREFEFGYYCKRCFLSAPTCTTPGCNNPSIVDKRLKTTLCRLCEFSYEPVLEIYKENNITDCGF